MILSHKTMEDCGYRFSAACQPAADLDAFDASIWDKLEISLRVRRDYPVCEGSLFDWSIKEWNLGNFPSPVRKLVSQGRYLPGITSSYIYHGEEMTFFPWHVEDWSLYSANILLWGLPKTWYAIPPAFARPMEILGQKYYPESYHVDSLHPFLNKTLLLTPDALERVGIPYAKVSNSKLLI